MKRAILHGSTVLGVILAIAGLVVLARLSDLDDALQLLNGAGPSLGWFVVPYTLATGLYALPWALLLPAIARPPWRAVLASRFASSAVNVLLPTGLVGEPLRLRSVEAGERTLATEALVWDRALYTAANGAFLLLVLVVALEAGRARAFWGATLLTSFVYVAGAALVVALTRFAPARRTALRLLRRLAPGLTDPRLRPPARSVATGLGLHTLGRLVLASEIRIGAQLLGFELPVSDAILVSASLVLVGAFFPVVPGQAGVQEAALAGAMLATGNDPDAGLALGLLIRLRQLVFVPLGLLLAAGPWLGRARERTA